MELHRNRESTTHHEWIEVNASRPCRHCGRKTWCRYTKDGQLESCRKNAAGSIKQGTDKAGAFYFLHRGPSWVDSPRPRVRAQARTDEPKLLPLGIEEKNAAYLKLLELCPPDKITTENLWKRQLEAHEIVRFQYGSLPEKNRSKIADQMVTIFGEDVCRRLPGLFKKVTDKKQYWTLTGGPATLIPSRQPDGKIQGLKLRLHTPDERGNRYLWFSSKKQGGLGCENYVHVPLHEGLDLSTLRITEGEFKADIATLKTGVLTLGLSGVYSWKNALPVVEQIKPKRVLVAFDADFSTNNEVKTCLISLVKALDEMNLEVQVEQWDAEKGKGIDDALTNNAIMLMETTENFLQRMPTIEEILRERGVAPSLPDILTNGRQVIEIIDDAWKALLAGNQPNPVLYLRCGRMVRLAETQDDLGAPKRLGIEIVDEDIMMGRLLRVARWHSLTDKGEVKHSAPKKVVAMDMLVNPKRGLPLLDSVVSFPCYGSDWKLMGQAGYYEKDRIYLDYAGDFDLTSVPEHPTDADVVKAKAWFKEMLWDFSFAEEASRTHFIGAVIAPFVRRNIHTTYPLHLIEAPAGGSAKSLLTKLIHLIVTGQSAVFNTFPKDEQEREKKLGTIMSRGRPIIVIDNASTKGDKVGHIHSDLLASILTSPSHEFRILGLSKTVVLPNPHLWFMTANNPKLSNELLRRSVRIRLKPKDQNAWQRKASSFHIQNIEQWTLQNRHHFLWSIFVLVNYWLAKGMPRFDERNKGSFEDWAQVIGGILTCAGYKGFLANEDQMIEEADEETSHWEEFVEAWWDEHGSTPVTVGTLNFLCDQKNLLFAERGDGGTRSQETKLGGALMGQRDNYFCGKQILFAGTEKRSKLYQLGLKQLDGTVNLELRFTQGSPEDSPEISFDESPTSPNQENLTNLKPHSVSSSENSSPSTVENFSQRELPEVHQVRQVHPADQHTAEHEPPRSGMVRLGTLWATPEEIAAAQSISDDDDEWGESDSSDLDDAV